MGDETKYEYRALNMGDGQWMVRRWPMQDREEDGVEEALITGDFSELPDSAIQAAIAQGSWA